MRFFNNMAKDDKPTRDALVIGIGQYADLAMPSEITKLVAGAEKIAQLLEKQGGFRVRRLPVTIQGDKEFVDAEQMLTAPELKMAIEQLLIPKSDSLPTTALLFFAGHGLLKEIKADRYEGFLATTEANPAEDEWGVSLQWLRELLAKSPIPQQIVWLDACHSGALFIPDKDLSGFQNLTGLTQLNQDLSGFQNLTGLTQPNQDLSGFQNLTGLTHDICFVSSARAHEEAYASGELTQALLETLDYTKQLNPWVDHLTLIEWLKAKNQTAAGSQRFVFAKTDKPIILTNKAFDIDADYKNVCPFKGLQSFDFEKNPDDPLYFKGRTELTNELVEKVQGANFLAVLGASGNGKSSVVRAGLLYQLRQTQCWKIRPVITPTSQPLSALGSVIGMPAAQLTDFIDRAQAERVVLVIDQFEEIFTVCKNDAEREQFLATLLAEVARADNKFCLVVVIRADFFDKYSQHVDLAKQIQDHQVIVTPMNAVELEEAIVAPTQQVGLQIEPKLVSEMLADVKGALGSLPLLQYTLRELWTKCAPHRLLTFSAYEELGKITGTLEKRANDIYNKLPSDKRMVAEYIFLELVQLEEIKEATRKPISEQDLVNCKKFENTLLEDTLQELIKDRLLVISSEQDTAIVDIAHEALIKNWSKLSEWLKKKQDYLIFRTELRQYLTKWKEHGKDSSLLLPGKFLDSSNEAKYYFNEIKNASETKTDVQNYNLKAIILSPEEYTYIELSFDHYRNAQTTTKLQKSKQEKLEIKYERLKEENKELKEKITVLLEKRFHNEDSQSLSTGKNSSLDLENDTEIAATRNEPLEEKEKTRVEDLSEKHFHNEDSQSKALKYFQRKSYQSIFILVIVFCLFLILLPTTKPKPHSELVLKLIENAEDTSNATDLSQLLVVQAFRYHNRFDFESDIENELLQIITKFKLNFIDFPSHNFKITSLAFSPDVKQLVTGDNDGNIIVWNIDTLKKHHLSRNKAPIELVAGNNDGNIIEWNIDTLKKHHLSRNKAPIVCIAFSFDSEKLITATVNTITIWKRINDYFVKKQEIKHDDMLINVIFEPKIQFWLLRWFQWFKKNKLLAISENGRVKIWKNSQNNNVSNIKFESLKVASFSFNSISNLLLAGTTEKTVKIWQVAKRKLLTEFKGHSDNINSIAFSPNGKWLASGSDDNTVRIWDMERKELRKKLSGHDKRVNHVIFSDNSQILATIGDNKQVKLWNINSQTPKIVFKGNEIGTSIAFSSDNKQLAIGGINGTTRLWIFEPQNWLEKACNEVRRNLTQEEWKRFIGDTMPYQKTCPEFPAGK
jgi:WD40 repeat protein